MLKMLPTLTMSATPIRARRSALLFLVTIIVTTHLYCVEKLGSNCCCS